MDLFTWHYHQGHTTKTTDSENTVKKGHPLNNSTIKIGRKSTLNANMVKVTRPSDHINETSRRLHSCDGSLANLEPRWKQTANAPPSICHPFQERAIVADATNVLPRKKTFFKEVYF
jgi:hypothetical protein